jgi:hypothetical protein
MNRRGERVTREPWRQEQRRIREKEDTFVRETRDRRGKRKGQALFLPRGNTIIAGEKKRKKKKGKKEKGRGRGRGRERERERERGREGGRERKGGRMRDGRRRTNLGAIVAASAGRRKTWAANKGQGWKALVEGNASGNAASLIKVSMMSVD